MIVTEIYKRLKAKESKVRNQYRSGPSEARDTSLKYAMIEEELQLQVCLPVKASF